MDNPRPATQPSARRSTFRSLRVRNFRLFFGGQVVSLIGSFMQAVAQGWLVLELSDSAAALGWFTAVQFLPLMLLGPVFGSLVDRCNRRRTFILTQSLHGATAVTGGLLVLFDAVSMPVMFVLAAAWGLVLAIDQPLRHSFVFDLVGPDDIQNASGLHMGLNSSSRVIGPLLAGVTIGAFDVATCFLLNGVSYIAVIVALFLIRPDELHAAAPPAHDRRGVGHGLRYVRSQPALWTTLALVAVFYGVGWSFDVVLPVLAKETFGGDATLFGGFNAALGVGAVVGSLAGAHSVRSGDRQVAGLAVGAAIGMVVCAVSSSTGTAVLGLALAGACGMAFTSLANTRMQLGASLDMRGRIMGLWAVATVGSRPLGSVIIGYSTEQLGPQWTLFIGGTAVAVGAAGWFTAARQIRPERYAAASQPGGVAVHAGSAETTSP